jgi:hypothetical protein
MLSYMSRGCALSWAEQKLEEVAAPGVEVIWEAFVASLCEAFGDSGHAVMAPKNQRSEAGEGHH